ncbi:MAG: DUF3267 domain-containing protein [Mogibacterium sp.]|nr:DUF3267 domain-containing protein [Mogibacterium sp.]
MKFHYKGRYSGNPEDIPHGRIKANSNRVEDYTDYKKFMVIMNFAAIGTMTVLFAVFCFISGVSSFSISSCYISCVLLIFHEMLHAVCFKEDVYLFTNFSNMSLFVVGTEDMSKRRTLVMTLLPNIVFGFLPFCVYLINNELLLCGSLGVLNIGMGAGDYYMAYKVLRKVPNDAKIYMHKMDTYWYYPE